MHKEKNVVYREYIYTLEERNENDISPLWRLVQILFYVCCIISGFGVCFSFSEVMVIMKNKCILYSNLVFYASDDPNHATIIKEMDSEFHNTCCDLVIYLPVLITAFASFFLVLFVICGRGGAGNDNIPGAWRIIAPTIVFNLICFLVTLFSANIFNKGLKSFLKNIADKWKRDTIDLKDIEPVYLDTHKVGPRLVKYITTSKHLIWMLVLFWGLSFFWILLRCLFNVDFQLVRTTIRIFPKPSIIKPSAVSLEGEISNKSSESVYAPENESHTRNVHFSPSTVFLNRNPQPKDNEVIDAATSVSNINLQISPSQEDLYIKDIIEGKILSSHTNE